MMTPFEDLQAKVALLFLRVERLEAMHEPNHLRRYDVAQALKVSGELGLDRGALNQLPPGLWKNTAKKRLAAELRRRGWTAPRVGRALNCSEKTVRRWSKPQNL